MSGHVFISYRHGDDAGYVQRLADHLNAIGVQPWFDREIVTGDRWERVIREKIDTCAAVVVVMTPQAEESDWVAREIDQAELVRKPVLPLLLQGRRFFRLSNVQYEDVTDSRMPSPAFTTRIRSLCLGPDALPEPDSKHVAPVPGPPVSATLVTTFRVGKLAPSLSLSGDGGTLAVAAGRSSAHLYDTATWTKRRTLRQHWLGTATVNAVAFHPSRTMVTTGGSETRGVWTPTSRAIVQNWDSTNGFKFGSVTWGGGRDHISVRSIAYSPDGHRLAICCYGSTTVHVRLANQSSDIFRVAHGDSAEDAAFSPDRRWLATASVDRTARICDARTGEQRFMLEHEYYVRKVAFSHDGRLLATASTPAHVWEVNTGKELSRLWPERDAYNRLVHDVAFSHDDRWLATAGGDGTVRIWDTKSFTQLGVMTHEDEISSIVFDPQGRWLVCGTFYGTLHVWRLA